MYVIAMEPPIYLPLHLTYGMCLTITVYINSNITLCDESLVHHILLHAIHSLYIILSLFRMVINACFKHIMVM